MLLLLGLGFLMRLGHGCGLVLGGHTRRLSAIGYRLSLHRKWAMVVLIEMPSGRLRCVPVWVLGSDKMDVGG